MLSRFASRIIAPAALLATATLPSAAADQITVSVIPIADCAPLYLGIEKGFFAERDLEIEVSTGGGGASIIPSVVAGQAQIGFSNVISMIVAQNRGLDLVALAPGASSTGEEVTDFAAIIVGPNSDIAASKDLEGKTVAVNEVNSIGDLAIRNAVRTDGGEASTLRFVEIPFPDVNAAIANNQVDAAWVVEPFLTQNRDNGAEVIDWLLLDVAPEMMIAVYFTSAEYAAANPEIVERFQAAISESLAYAQENPDEVRAIIPTFTRIPPEMVARINLPKWTTELNRESSQRLAELALQDGLIDAPADIAEIMP